MAARIAGIAHLQIPLEKILGATNNFSDKNIIGKGGFGNVYRMKLEHDGEMIKVAARRLDRKYGQGDVEFWTEVSMLSSLRDKRCIVTMIGFCDEKGEKIIVNKRYPKGSLSTYISDPTLGWSQRFDIARLICMGLDEIHRSLGSDYIIHRNINSSTILLDSEWFPRLSGFEFSIKHSEERRNQFVLSEAMGTKGYIDPAIEKYGGVNHKSDIYSVGVILFELLCGRKAFEGNRLLAPLAKLHYENATLKDIIHPDIWNQMNPHTLKYFSKAAYSCLEEEPTQRPDAKQLEVDLQTAIYFQMEETHWKLKIFEQNAFDEDDQPSIWSTGNWPQNKNVKTLIGTEEEEDELELPKNVLELSLEKWEHLRIGLTDIRESPDSIKSPRSSLVKGQYIFFSTREIECYDRECVSLKNRDELPKRHYTAAMKLVKPKEDVFVKEIGILGSCRHPNIQSFLGFYDDDSMMMLFYEYVSFKFLHHCLDGNFTWEKRLKICIGVAHGLDYLHNEMEDQNMVIHGDINGNNIELDDILGAQIVGFENSVILCSNQDEDFLQLDENTYDKYYMDPECAETGKLKRESDVFSFGVVMLELLCGMHAQDVISKEGNKDKGIAPLARRWFDEGTIKEKLSPRIKEEYYGNNLFLKKGPNKDSLDAFINIVFKCLAESQMQRPEIKVVIKELQKALSFHENHKDPLRMSFNDIKLATQDFDRANCIGGGGFGLVYKGKVAHGKVNGHSTIVTKKLDKSQGQGEKQYYNELQILYQYNHENVIGLIGYSNETDEKIIVYEHASRGSLDKHLNNASLTWRNRLKICIDVATGLNFLHEGIQGQGVVIHRDIKTANILLFDDWKAKVGDFGLSLISTINKEINFTIDHPCGTHDYVDPMYLQSGILTVESDVYSFGVALFEILCGRAIYTITKDKCQSLLSFIKYNFENGKQDELVFRAIKEEIVSESLTTFLNIVYKCLDDDREKRPTTKVILAQLENTLEIQDKNNI